MSRLKAIGRISLPRRLSARKMLCEVPSAETSAMSVGHSDTVSLPSPSSLHVRDQREAGSKTDVYFSRPAAAPFRTRKLLPSLALQRHKHGRRICSIAL